MVYTDSCGLCKNTLYYTHIYTGGKSMAEEIRFVSGQMPSLLYATKQIVAASAITRAIHRHERFTEMLYVYQGAGQYIAGGYSYPIRTGDILLYNQGDLHEVTSSLQHEIGTLCFGISGLQLCGLPEGHFTKAENGFVRPAMDEIDHMQSLSELIYEHAERRTSYSDEIVAQLLPALVLLAGILKKVCANYNGVLARYGGDEFCIACGCNSVEVRTLIASIQRELDAANAASGKPYQIEISIGCARLEPDIATVHDLIDKADQEMYHLKTRKRGIS